MARDLTTYLKAVYACSTIDTKKQALVDLVQNSSATKDTKDKSLRVISALSTNFKLDKFATNYVLSGEGMKVQ